MKQLTDNELLKEVNIHAKKIREQTMYLLELLTEVNNRKLYCDLSYSSLFKYIVEELKFSESQAVIYSNLVKSKTAELMPVKEMITNGSLSLFSASTAAQIIREQNIQDKITQIELMQTFKNLSKAETVDRANKLKNKEVEKIEALKISKELEAKLNKIKKKFNLPNEMKAEQLLGFMADTLLTEKEELKVNKTITPKTRTLLKLKAKHQCQYIHSSGRCKETKNLEIDHIIPKAIGGDNHPSNLRIYCREHNQRAAIKHMGSHIIKKRK